MMRQFITAVFSVLQYAGDMDWTKIIGKDLVGFITQPLSRGIIGSHSNFTFMKLFLYWYWNLDPSYDKKESTQCPMS